HALGALAATGVLFAVFLAYLRRYADPGQFKSVGDLVAPAAVGAVAAAILIGGLFACIYVAVKTHHMAGLSLEAREPPEEEQSPDADDAE
ncbi:MAG: hypothetical protein KAX19_13160, partial [Candidatus Brocadiae bacterium]|nr:hypothetical protein [Candidatus Brocadiia bacterium]